MRLLYLENLPRLLDALDSEVFVLRTRLAGGLGIALWKALFWLALGLAVLIHPISSAIAVSALGVYLSATLLRWLAVMPRSLRQSSAAAR